MGMTLGETSHHQLTKTVALAQGREVHPCLTGAQKSDTAFVTGINLKPGR